MFNIKKEQIVCATTDGGANVVKAMCDCFGPERHQRCMCHFINIFVRKAIALFSMLVRCMKLLKLMVKFVKLSSKSMDELKSLQIEAKECQVLVLMQSVETRWNSEFLSARRFLRLQKYVQKVLQKRRDECRSTEMRDKIPVFPNEDEIQLLTDFVTLFEPFLVATEILSGDHYVTSSLVIPVMFSTVKDIREREAQHPEGKKMQAYLIEELEKVCNDVENNLIFAKSTLLDPRLKKDSFQSPAACSKAVARLQLEMKNLEPSAGNTRSAEGGTSLVSKNVPAANDLFAKMENYVFIAKQKTTVVVAPNEFDKELREYLQESSQEASSNPIKYWVDRKFVYPRLYNIAVDHLCIMASSTPSERIVSSINCVATNKRSSLLSNNIDALVFLRSAGPETWNSIWVNLIIILSNFLKEKNL